MSWSNFFRWRRRTTYILVGALVFGLVYLVGLYISTHIRPTVEVRVGSGVYQLWLADTEKTRAQGLSGVTSLQQNSGLLMKFDEMAIQDAWTAGTSVPMDIVWLDDAKSVVYIIKNVNLGASKEEQDAGLVTSYSSVKPARYALELPAGSVQNAGIKSGDAVEFDETNKGVGFTWSQ